MDRRVFAWLAGFSLLAGGPREGVAQGPVGMSPIRSIGESINDTTNRPGLIPVAPSAAPSSPIGVGPDGVVPRSPIEPEPVSMVPLDSINQSINRGFGGISSIFSRYPSRPDAGPILRRTPRVEPAPRFDAATFPSTLNRPPQGGRPAPFARQTPQAPRPQAPAAGSGDSPGRLDQGPGRPAPFAALPARSPRPRPSAVVVPVDPPAAAAIPEPEPVAPLEPAQEPAPVMAPGTEPTPTPTPLPAVAEPVPAPAPEAETAPPVGPDPAPSPLGGDPLGKLEPIPAAAPEPAPAPSQEPAPVPLAVDPEVKRTNFDAAAMRTEPLKPRRLSVGTIRAASVGDEIITFNELDLAVTDQMKEVMAGQQGGMSKNEIREVQNQIAASILNRMIDQALVVQEARRKMLKNAEAKQKFDKYVDEQWKANELPPLLRKTASTNIHELKIKLTSEGKSYEGLKEAYRKKMMFHEFLRAEIHNKVTADMIELKAYYTSHRDQFDQPARMTWREIEILKARYSKPADAREKADEVLARLLRDEDFATLARSVSNGPTASKGGVYVDMQPGSYGIPVVNAELDRLPIGQVSQVLESPTAFHVIRVDSRREKGPLRFDEVQDKIKGLVLEQNFQRAVEDYLAKLRVRTEIRTMFDNTASDPDIARKRDAAMRQASGPR